MVMDNSTQNNNSRRNGLDYILTEAQIVQYKNLGYLVIENVLSDAEMAVIDPWFEHFISGQHTDMGRDLCDMSQPSDTPFDKYQLVNAMLPSVYEPKLANSVYELVAHSISKQLYGSDGVKKDYDQFLAKKPGFDGAKFAMHQDLGYWPNTLSTWTATFSLALNDSNLDNGCLQVVPGSNKEIKLRSHLPTALNASEVDETGASNDFHTLSVHVGDSEEILFLPVKRGSMTIHDERIVHGSAGNISDRWRQTYVIAFREIATIEEERRVGFTHSHNDNLDWKATLSKS
jgi:ectoine hydroxylase-related dioxygenase (phytanoyl-CoA dioxygenase family)